MEKELLQTQKETVMLLAILAKRNVVQSSLIVEMATIGFSPRRIAELLNTTSNTVSVTLLKARKRKNKK